ncbi:Fimbrial protein pilin, partial [Candidatus Thiomargarita nelsonii]
YMRKAKISEGMQLMGAIKTGVSTFFAEEGTLPTVAEFASLDLKTAGKYVTNIVYAQADTNTLTATFENITGELQYDWNDSDWECHNGTTALDIKILPKVCQ